MKSFNSTDIKIGILRDIKKQFTNGSFTATLNAKSRGIIFEDAERCAHDIIYPTLYYPYYEDKNYLYRTKAVASGEDLAPLLEYFNMETFSYEDLQEFIGDVLLSRMWLKENEEKFGVVTDTKPFLKRIEVTEGESLFSCELYKVISDIQNNNGFNLTRSEQKRFALRK